MKIKLSILTIIILSSIFFANCTSEEEKAEIALKELKTRYTNEVMNVHDEIMPLTMKIPPLQEDLEAIKMEQPEMTTPIDEALSNLQEAYDAMYQWMDNSGKVQSELYKMEGEAANERLEKERKLILYIQGFTESAIKEGKALNEKLAK
jgi:hypothetical protein